MKKLGKIILWILGTITWLFILMLFWYVDTPTGNNTHKIILIITGALLALYIWRSKDSGAKDLKKENQELKEENQQLRQELEQAQAVQRAMEKAEKREKKN